MPTALWELVPGAGALKIVFERLFYVAIIALALGNVSVVVPTIGRRRGPGRCLEIVSTIATSHKIWQTYQAKAINECPLVIANAHR